MQRSPHNNHLSSFHIKCGMTIIKLWAAKLTCLCCYPYETSCWGRHNKSDFCPGRKFADKPVVPQLEIAQSASAMRVIWKQITLVMICIVVRHFPQLIVVLLRVLQVHLVRFSYWKIRLLEAHPDFICRKFINIYMLLIVNFRPRKGFSKDPTQGKKVWIWFNFKCIHSTSNRCPHRTLCVLFFSAVDY